jgi:hypothetical protein
MATNTATDPPQPAVGMIGCTLQVSRKQQFQRHLGSLTFSIRSKVKSISIAAEQYQYQKSKAIQRLNIRVQPNTLPGYS